jgi:precorrin-2/cobalt-factor-2 C20-methyltransferase
MEVKGIFYGVGVGPGDPELMTLKALRVLERCPVVAAPQTKSGEMLALDIVKQAMSLENKIILPLFFSMARKKEDLTAAHTAAADAVEAHLKAGRDVAMLNLGDVSIYATFGYLKELLEARGYETVMVPGVPSFCAAAARLNTSLTSWDTPLHVAPGDDAMGEVLDLPGTKVLMKAGRRLPQALDVLREKNLLQNAALVCNCGLPGEAVYPDLEQLPDLTGYFTTIIVKEEP